MDYLAGILELLAVWMVGNKNKYGFIVFICGSVFWSISGFKAELYGLSLTSTIFMIINIRNFIKWGQK